jgi:hypothetical protein
MDVDARQSADLRRELRMYHRAYVVMVILGALAALVLYSLRR